MTILGKVVLHITAVFAPALVYVMLSRVTSRASIKLTDKVHAEWLVPLKF
jgi:hypothetical protein